MLKIIFIVAALCLSQAAPVYAQSPEVPLNQRTLPEIVTHFADQYHVSTNVMFSVMKCESGGNQKAIGDNGHAFGIYQFHRPTFDGFSKEFGESLDINSAYDQAKLASWAISQGYGYHWTCYRPA